jgi:transcriptional regulator with XRE-family HTH domain
MARRKTQPDAVRTKYDLAERLRVIRTELYGERGGPELARRLGVPIRTWYNYESGVTVPSEVLLRLIELTSVEPAWLLHGSEPRYRVVTNEDATAATSSVQSLLRTVLHRLEGQSPPVRAAGGSAHAIDGPKATGSEVRGAQVEGKGQARPNVAGPSGVRVPPTLLEQPDWIAAQNEGRYVRMDSDAMVPIVAEGAFVAFADADQDASELDGKLVVAWVDGRPLVRWFEKSGHYALLRAENPSCEPPMTLLDLQGPPEARRVRRVLWIGTQH